MPTSLVVDYEQQCSWPSGAVPKPMEVSSFGGRCRPRSAATGPLVVPVGMTRDREVPRYLLGRAPLTGLCSDGLDRFVGQERAQQFVVGTERAPAGRGRRGEERIADLIDTLLIFFWSEGGP